MKKYLILTLISSLLISSCTIDWKDENKAKIEKLEKQVSELKKEKEVEIDKYKSQVQDLNNKITNDIFKKKQECLKLTEELKTKVTNFGINLLWGTPSFEQVFYSTEKNNCLWVISYEKVFDTGGAIWNNNLYEVGNDSPSSQILASCTKSISVPGGKDDCDVFYEKIKKFKGE